MFPGLMAVKFNLFALLVVEGDGGAGAALATVPTAAGKQCPRPARSHGPPRREDKDAHSRSQSLSCPRHGFLQTIF